MSNGDPDVLSETFYIREIKLVNALWWTNCVMETVSKISQNSLLKVCQIEMLLY